MDKDIDKGKSQTKPTLLQRIEAWFYEPPIIERNITVNGREITAKYNPTDGEFKFYNRTGKPYELNGAGAFTTVSKVLEAFHDIDMNVISYDLNKSDKHVHTKEALYARALRSRGYVEKKLFTQRKSIWQYHRTWVKKNKRKKGLERIFTTLSAAIFCGGLALVVPTITGNAIIQEAGGSVAFIGTFLAILGILALQIKIKLS